MKKLNLFVFTLISIFGFGILNVKAETEGYFSYSVNGDKVTITGYSNSGPKEVVIPETINGKSVTAIGDYVFYDNVEHRGYGITSVTIPEGVTKIGTMAFASNQLTNVVIPSSVTTIESFAFMNNQLTSATIPSNVITIGGQAFFGNQLTSVTIPSSVTTIEGFAFSENHTLKKVVILGKTTQIGNYNYDVFYNSIATGFKMYGYAGSTAETYANATGGESFKEVYDFVSLKELTNDMIAEIPTQYFTGTTLKPVVTIKDGETPLKENVNYMITYSNNDAVGTGKVTITGINDYEYATATKTFTIAKKQYSVIINPITGVTITPNSTIKVDYDGSQNYKITAEDGYKITSILVNGVEKLSTLSNNVLKIENPTEDMTIEVKTEKIEEHVVTTPVLVENPKTSDSILLYVGLSLISLLGITRTDLYIKKRFN